MILTFNLSKLNNKNLSPTEFVICYLLYNKEYQLLKDMVACLDYDSVTGYLKKLEDKRFIKITYEGLFDTAKFEKIHIRQAFIDLLDLDNSAPFEELRSNYPKSTPSGRRLHSNLAAAKKKYLDFLKGNLELHKDVLQCIRLEVKGRLSNKSLDYMQNLSTYINQKSWEAYMEDVQKVKERIKNGEEPENGEDTEQRWTKVL
jgi:hypothetical protein